MFRLRALTLLASLTVLAPGAAQAAGFGGKGGGHGGGRGGAHGAAPSNGVARPPVYGAPRGAYYGGPRYGYGYGYGGAYGGYYAPGYVAPSYYYGWGIHPWGYYGYGYYPYYGGPVVAEQVGVSPPNITSSVFLGGMGSNVGPGLDLRGMIEGQRFGVNFDLAALPGQNTDGSTSLLPYFTAHATYSFISDMHLRLRAEAGVSAIAAPGVSYVGPDIGVTGQVALIGPLGAEAAVHWTPIPADILDAELGLALHFGNLGIRGGWRILRLDDTHVNDTGGVDVISGPTISVGLVF